MHELINIIGHSMKEINDYWAIIWALKHCDFFNSILGIFTKYWIFILIGLTIYIQPIGTPNSSHSCLTLNLLLLMD